MILRRQASSFIEEETHSNTGIVKWALETIREVVSQIKGKKKWWLAFSKGSVKSKIEGCTNGRQVVYAQPTFWKVFKINYPFNIEQLLRKAPRLTSGRTESPSQSLLNPLFFAAEKSLWSSHSMQS